MTHRAFGVEGAVLALLLAGALVSPWTAGWVNAEELQVRAVACGEPAGKPEALNVVELVPEGGSAATRQRTLPSSDLSWAVEVGKGEVWDLSLVGEELWSQAVRVPRGRGEGVLTIPFWPEARLVGRVRVPRGETVPDALTLRLNSTERRRPDRDGPCRLEEVIVDCRIAEDADFACSVPAGSWNLRAKAPGWAARYLWDVPLEAEKPMDLGALRLKHGATLVGQLTTVDGPADPRTSTVRLTPSAVVGSGDRTEGQLEELALEARITPDGYFAFEGVPPGIYLLAARQPGFSPARLFPVEVRLDRETILRPLVLEPEAMLRVELEPPRTPDDEPWQIAVFERALEGGSSDVVDRGPVDEGGAWTSRPLPVGRYDVEVRDSLGRIFGVRDEVELAGGSIETLRISFDLVEVAGAVFLGDDPLAATLWFGGRSGSRRIEVTADDEGQFAVVLPGSGEWRVDVLAEEPSISYLGHRVEIDESGEDDLEIRVPDTSLAGEVVDAEGLPISAGVLLVATDGARQLSGVRSQRDGRFEILGLEEGTYWIEAQGEGLRSNRVTVPVMEDADTPFVRLVLRPESKLEGIVVSDHGPVVGAMVLAMPLSDSGQLLAMMTPQANTEATGRFELALPGETARIVLVVMPPGFALTTMRAEPGELTVRVSPPDGTIVLEVPPVREESADREARVLMVDGVPVHQSLLHRWAEINGVTTTDGAFTVPAMRAGDYAYCALEMAEALAVLAEHALPVNCSTGFLSIGGTLNLRAP